MKNLFISITALLFSCTIVSAQNADLIKGTWLNGEKDAKIEVYKSGDNYFGKLIWLKQPYEADGKTLRKDAKNSNGQLRNRTILNMVILSGFVFDEGEWTGGEVYDPKTGKTYKSNMKLKGNQLEIRGYVGAALFGKTTVWTRTS